jgi:hypothetical protein
VGDPGVQDSSRKGLSTFLADHEDCGKGFDIQRRAGTNGSIVRVVCGGCGQAIEYPAAADAELPDERTASRRVSERIRSRDRRARAKPTAASDDPGPQASPRRGNSSARPRGEDVTEVSEPRSRSLALPAWLSASLIALLLGAGLLLVVLGLASDSGISDRETAGNGGSASPVAPASPSPLTVTGRSEGPAPRVKLERRRFAERIAIGVPDGWRAGVSDGALTLLSRNGRSEVQVYYEQGAKPSDELEQQSKEFLLQRHPGARVAANRPTDLGGHHAGTITVAYRGGTESATVLVAAGYTYLILDRLTQPVTPEFRRTTSAVVASFRPA